LGAVTEIPKRFTPPATIQTLVPPASAEVPSSPEPEDTNMSYITMHFPETPEMSNPLLLLSQVGFLIITNPADFLPESLKLIFILPLYYNEP
jgi:hypothetical protein